MNEQEIDRLWLKHADGADEGIPYAVMTRNDFAQAAAEIRRQAFADVVRHFDCLADEVEKTAQILEERGSDESAINEYRRCAEDYRDSAAMVVALAQSEQEKS